MAGSVQFTGQVGVTKSPFTSTRSLFGSNGKSNTSTALVMLTVNLIVVASSNTWFVFKLFQKTTGLVWAVALSVKVRLLMLSQLALPPLPAGLIWNLNCS